jgi:hypothetical protein
VFKCPNEQEIEGAQMKSIVLGLLALLISACNGSRTEQLLLNQVQALVRSAQETDKVLKLNQINGLEWDEMLVIRPYTSFNSLDEELSSNKVLLATEIDARDDITVMLFKNVGAVVGVVEFPRAVFDFSQINSQTYTPNDRILLTSDNDK